MQLSNVRDIGSAGWLFSPVCGLVRARLLLRRHVATSVLTSSARSSYAWHRLQCCATSWKDQTHS